MQSYNIQAIQEDEYVIPYHYLAEWDSLLAFPRKIQNSPAYLYYLKKVIALIGNPDASDTILDAGCGDGRLIFELQRSGCQANLSGLDYSENAIYFARHFNPKIDFQVADLTKKNTLPDKQYNIVISVETLEHIDPLSIGCVIKNIADLVASGGNFIVTVPHLNRKLDSKHYQHFTVATLQPLLQEEFCAVDFYGFYKQSFVRYVFSSISILYYFLFPLRKVGLTFIPQAISRFGFFLFERFLIECNPDEGNSLIAVCKKA